MGRNECSCQSLINPIKELQQVGSNVLLARVPHETTHGPMAIIKKMLEAMTNVIKSRALKNIVPLIAHMHARGREGRRRQPVPWAASCPMCIGLGYLQNDTLAAQVCAQAWRTEIQGGASSF